MSIEQLLLLLFLVGIPLLERLIRVMRERTSGSPAERTSTAGSEPAVPRPRPRVPVPPTMPEKAQPPAPERPLAAPPAPPARSEMARSPAPEQLRASERERARLRRERQHGPAARVGAAPTQQARRRGAALQSVITGGDLRRAVVLTAILGPCRALERDENLQQTFEGARGR